MYNLRGLIFAFTEDYGYRFVPKYKRGTSRHKDVCVAIDCGDESVDEVLQQLRSYFCYNSLENVAIDEMLCIIDNIIYFPRVI